MDRLDPQSDELEPNEETKAAMAELDAGEGEVFDGSTEDFIQHLVAEPEPD